MASTTYVDFTTPAISAAWLNDVNAVTYGPNPLLGPDATDYSALAFFRNNLTVQMFGAVGDGIADDVVAIQNSINYLLTLPTGGRMRFPAGTYNMSTRVSIVQGTNQAIVLSGDAHATNFRYTGTIGGITLFDCGQPVAIFGADLVFEDLGFSQATMGVPANGIGLFNNNSAVINNVNMYSLNNGIILNNSFNTRISNCHIYGSVVAGITTNGTGTNSLIVRDCTMRVNGIAINLLIGGNNILIEGNDFEANGITLGITNYTSVRFAGNYVELGTNVVFFFAGVNSSIDIEQNWLGQNAVSTNFGSITNGNFRKNTIFQSTWTTTATDFLIGYNTVISGGVVPLTKWTVPALAGGFVQQNVNYFAPQFLKNEDGVVTMRGNTTGGANGFTMFVLPAGYRPSAAMTFATASSVTPGTSVIEVRANGDVVCLVRDAGGGCGWNCSWAGEQ